MPDITAIALGMLRRANAHFHEVIIGIAAASPRDRALVAVCIIVGVCIVFIVQSSYEVHTTKKGNRHAA